MRKIAVGIVEDNLRKTAIGFPEELFTKIRMMAADNDRSFSSQVRWLCEKALKDER